MHRGQIPSNNPKVSTSKIAGNCSLPAKEMLSLSRAGRGTLCARLLRLAAEEMGPIEDAESDDTMGFRTYGVASVGFKEQLSSRNMPIQVADLYRKALLPKYIWVTEIEYRERRDAREPAVLGEVILDGTAHHLTEPDDEDPASLLALHLRGSAGRISPDSGFLQKVEDTFIEPYESGCPAYLSRL